MSLETSTATESPVLPEGTKVNCDLDYGPDRKPKRKSKYYEIYYRVVMTANGKGGFIMPTGELLPTVGFYYNAKSNSIDIDSGIERDKPIRDYWQKHGQKLYAECWLG